MAEEREKNAYVGRSGATSSPRVHSLCQKRLSHATNKSERTHTSCMSQSHFFTTMCRQLCSLHARRHDESRLVSLNTDTLMI